MRDKLNQKIKFRERYRPYAPAVLEERAREFFDMEGASPSMLRVVPVKTASLPAITHVDGSARVQTVSRRDNPIFYDLIHAFAEITHVPVLLNTSFNRAGQPIVESPEDAIDAFLAMNMDILVIHDHVVTRADIPPVYQNQPFTAALPEEVSVNDRFITRHPLRYLVGTAYNGEERDIVRLYGLNRFIELEIGSLPLLVELCDRRRFLAGEVESWSLMGSRYAWKEVRRLLGHLLDQGFIERDRDCTDRGQELATLPVR